MLVLRPYYYRFYYFASLVGEAMTYESQTELPKRSSAENSTLSHGSSQWTDMRQLNTDEQKFYHDMNGLLVGDKTLPDLHLHDPSKDSHHQKDSHCEKQGSHDHDGDHGKDDHGEHHGRHQEGGEHSGRHGSKSHSHHHRGKGNDQAPLTPEAAAQEMNADIRNLTSDLNNLSADGEMSKTATNEIIDRFKQIATQALAAYDRQYSPPAGSTSSEGTQTTASTDAHTPVPTSSTSDVSTPSTSDTSAASPTTNPPTELTSANNTPIDTSSGTAGVPDGAKLTKHVGDIVITKPGTVLDHMDIYGRIKVEAANVTIKDCVVHGDAKAPTYNTALIDCNSGAAKNVLIEDSTLAPTTPSVWTDGVIGHDYTADRVNTYNVVDGFGVYNNTGNKKDANVTIENSDIHDLSYFANDPNHSDGTHNDGIQIQGGGNIRIIDNTIEAFKSKTAGTQGSDKAQAPGSGILIQGNVSPVFDLDVEGNTIDGSKAGINIRTNAAGSQPIGEVIDNRLGRNEWDYGNGSKYPIRVQSKAIDKLTAPLTSNVWSDNGEPLADGRNLGIRYDS